MSTTNNPMLVSFSDDRRRVFGRLNAQGYDLFTRPGLDYWNFCLRDGIRILDCGCGSGWWLRWIGQMLDNKGMSGHLLGIDSAEDFVEWAREEQCKGIVPEYIVGDFADKASHQGREFDVIHVSQAILGGGPDVHRTLKTLMSSLKADGCLVIQEISLDDYQVSPPCEEWTAMVRAMQENWIKRYGHPQDADQFVHFMHQAGFEDVIETKAWARTQLKPHCGFFPLFETFLPTEEQQVGARQLIAKMEQAGAFATRSRSYIIGRKSK